MFLTTINIVIISHILCLLECHYHHHKPHITQEGIRPSKELPCIVPVAVKKHAEAVVHQQNNGHKHDDDQRRDQEELLP